MQDYSYASDIQRISASSYHNPTENISCAPCNKLAMTNNPCPSRKIGAKPAPDYFPFLLGDVVDDKHCSHGIQTLFSLLQSIVLIASMHSSYGVEAMFLLINEGSP